MNDEHLTKNFPSVQESRKVVEQQAIRYNELMKDSVFMIQYPPVVGYWKLDQSESNLGSTMISMMHKPTDQQIKNTEDTFGWRWIDVDDR